MQNMTALMQRIYNDRTIAMEIKPIRTKTDYEAAIIEVERL